MNLPVAGGLTSLGSDGHAGKTGGQSQQGDGFDRGHDVLIASNSNMTKKVFIDGRRPCRREFGTSVV